MWYVWNIVENSIKPQSINQSYTIILLSFIGKGYEQDIFEEKGIYTLNITLNHFPHTKRNAADDIENIYAKILKLSFIEGLITKLRWKLCGKRRNCLLCASSPFATVFSKVVCSRGIKRVCMWERVKHKMMFDKSQCKNRHSSSNNGLTVYVEAASCLESMFCGVLVLESHKTHV